MRGNKPYFESPLPWLFLAAACAHTVRAQAPLETIDNRQDGKIVYGLVDGAASPAAAMDRVRRLAHAVRHAAGWPQTEVLQRRKS